MKNLKWLLAALFMISTCIPSFARRVHLHGKGTRGDKILRSVNLDISIIADINETSKVLSLEFLEYIGEVRVSVADTNGYIVYEGVVDTQDASFHIIPLNDIGTGLYELSISDSENYAEGFFNL